MSVETWKWIEFYASRGLRVFPVWGTGDNGACLCAKSAACGKTAGKHPIPDGWQHVATTELQTLKQWWQRHPKANIGIATSAAFTILDIDPRNGGDVTFDAMLKQHGPALFESP